MRDAISSFFAECIRIVFVGKPFLYLRIRRKSMPMKKTNSSQNGSSPKSKDKKQQEEENFKIMHVFEALVALPRVIRLVWSTQARLTTAMAVLSILRGFTPAVSFWITKQLIDSVVNAIKTHHIAMVLWFVGAQLVVSLLDRLLSTLGKIVQQLVQTVITLFSMILLLVQLAWWLAVVALIVPIPSFIASSRYGWIGYVRMRRESPDRRKMYYFNRLITDDDYNKEIK